MLAALLDELVLVAGDADHLDVRIQREQSAHPLTHDQVVVVREDDADPLHPPLVTMAVRLGKRTLRFGLESRSER